MKLLDHILDLLYPPRCPFCRKLLRDWEPSICRSCEKTLPYVPEAVSCRQFKGIAKCVSPLYYEGTVRDSLLRYKFSGVTAYRRVYAELISKCIDENDISCDIITWVPLSRRRLRRRGYDQAKLIAEAIAKNRSLPCESLLKKIRNNPPQSKTGSAGKRADNAAGVYQCRDTGQIFGKNVLIIDDIVTTGATLSECARMLSAAGAVSISAATVARGKD